jgi:hypothetical protein
MSTGASIARRKSFPITLALWEVFPYGEWKGGSALFVDRIDVLTLH